MSRARLDRVTLHFEEGFSVRIDKRGARIKGSTEKWRHDLLPNGRELRKLAPGLVARADLPAYGSLPEEVALRGTATPQDECVRVRGLSPHCLVLVPCGPENGWVGTWQALHETEATVPAEVPSEVPASVVVSPFVKRIYEQSCIPRRAWDMVGNAYHLPLAMLLGCTHTWYTPEKKLLTVTHMMHKHMAGNSAGLERALSQFFRMETAPVRKVYLPPIHRAREIVAEEIPNLEELIQAVGGLPLAEAVKKASETYVHESSTYSRICVRIEPFGVDVSPRMARNNLRKAKDFFRGMLYAFNQDTERFQTLVDALQEHVYLGRMNGDTTPGAPPDRAVVQVFFNGTNYVITLLDALSLERRLQNHLDHRGVLKQYRLKHIAERQRQLVKKLRNQSRDEIKLDAREGETVDRILYTFAAGRQDDLAEHLGDDDLARAVRAYMQLRSFGDLDEVLQTKQDITKKKMKEEDENQGHRISAVIARMLTHVSRPM